MTGVGDRQSLRPPLRESRIHAPRDGRSRVAVVGVGLAGQSHLLDAITDPRVECVAVCARRRERAASVATTYGVEAWFDDVDAMLKRVQPDALVVASPPQVMAAHAVAGLRRGIDVLCEKPVAVARHELRELRDAERVGGATLVVGYTRRYRAAWIAAREWVRSGEIGTVQRLDYLRRGPFRRNYSLRAPTHRVRSDERVGGVLLDHGSHALDGVLMLLGDLGAIRTVTLEIDPANDADVEVVMTLAISNGAAIEIRVKEAEREDECVTMRGSRGIISLAGRRARLSPFDQRRAIEVDDYYARRPIEDIVAPSEEGRALRADLDQAGTVVESLIDAYRLAGRPLRRSWRQPRAKALARLSGAC